MDKATFTALVTRPQHQSTELCERIQSNGWRAVSFPTIGIRKLTVDHIPDIAKFDTLIFISRNAVESALKTWSVESFSGKQLIAIGKTTAGTLEAQGMTGVQFVAGEANSERLLEMRILQADQVENAKIMILSGLDGRELLAETLTHRGAEVETLALYERFRPCYDVKEIERYWCPLPDVIVITSNESADNLAEIMQTCDYYQSMFTVQTVVMSERIRQHVARIGFIKESAVAETTDNDGLFAAIVQCFNEVNRE